MKKLLILSTSFVSLMSTANFFSLRLDRFIQLLTTSSIVIGLEFVFSNLCLTVSENLFSLSLQESLNLFAFCLFEVIREPLLARGLLGEFDISLCDEVVVGLITCGRLVLGQGGKVLSGSTQGIYPRHHGI